MKNLKINWSLFFLMSIFIFSCKNELSSSDTKTTVEKSKPENTQKKQFSKATISFEIKGDDTAPQSLLIFTNGQETHEVLADSPCTPIESIDFTKNEIPKEAEVACYCWWAGSGHKYYATNSNNHLQVFKKYTGEGDVDDWSVIYDKQVIEFVLEGHEVMDIQDADLNADGRKDVLLALKAIEEENTDDIDNPNPRPLLILTRNKDNSLSLAQRNDNTILCLHCGGVFGDPYNGMVIKGNYFSVQHFGGSNWKWTRILTYKYDEAQQNWYLHKDGGSEISPAQETTEWVKDTKDFGTIEFKNFNIYKFLR